MSPYPVYMPDGRIAPLLMTAEEACHLLRIEIEEGKTGAQALDWYRRGHGLRATIIGKHLKFRLQDVLEFINRHAEETPR